MIPTFDFETYSDAGYRYDPVSGSFIPLQSGKPGLMGINAAVYAEHDSTRVISMAYNLIDGCGTRLWTPGSPTPLPMFNYIWSGGLIEAHNSAFEFYVWKYVCQARMGWPELRLEQLVCSFAKAQASGYPGALGKLSNILSPSVVKDKRGTALIRLLSVPKKPTKKDPALYRSFDRHPDLYYEMYAYNDTDVEAEMSISAMLPELSGTELAVWQLDQRINTRGVKIDTVGLDACIKLFEATEAKYLLELRDITGGQVSSIGELAKLKSGDKWLQSLGVNMPSLNKATVIDTLARPDIPSEARRALEIRQEIGGAAVKKIYAMHRCLNSDGRIRGMLQYCGAERTGRWAGRGPQPHNLRNGGPDGIHCKACDTHSAAAATCPRCGSTGGLTATEWGDGTATQALSDIQTQTPDEVERLWGSATELIGSCMRALFVAAPGHDLLCSDYSAIEAVVLAALAGEEWRLEVFATHGKIYEASAAKSFNVPLQEILDHKARTGQHHPLRKKGKVRELANGYAGWINASKAFGHTGTDDEIKADVLAWREDSPRIVEMWGGQYRKDPNCWHFTPELYGVEGMFVAACLRPDVIHRFRDLTFEHQTADDILYLRLPSGRCLKYHNPRLYNDTDPRGLAIKSITFMGVDSYTGRWSRQNTYGGKLVENVTQAVARDILAAALVRLDKAGYATVVHVHDEIVCEVKHGHGSVEHMEAVMEEREPWFAEWPIKAAGGWRGLRYRK